MIGQRIGPYEVSGRLGQGGMGEVYRATDTRLDREVAIKVSGERFSERFEREARAVAALNHPNICTLFDVGPDYLVMEYVEGTPVAPVRDLRKLLDIAVQIASGMAAAHQAGLIHRDLKPDNILVTREGRVKILDFGLAKRAPGGRDEDEATRAGDVTEAGTTVGTVAYMSPEQARGEHALGPQSDQFSLGLILYELVTGRRPFQRDSAAETMAAIIRDEAEPLPVDTPAPLRWVIERLLAKDPADRYDSSLDVYRELRRIRERLSQSAPAVPVTRTAARPRLRPGVAAALAGVALGAALTWWLLPQPAVSDLSTYRFTPVSRDPATEWFPAWSPDGTSIAYTATIRGVAQVMTRGIGSSSAAQLTRLDGSAETPFWSPDGGTIYYVSDSVLWAIPATGGAPERVLEVADSRLPPGKKAAVHPDGRTFAILRGGKLWVGAAGETPREFGQPPFEPPAAVEEFTADGSRLAVVKDGDVWVLAYPSGEARRYATGTAVSASWMPDSRRIIISAAATDSTAFTIAMLDTANGQTRVLYTGPFVTLFPRVSPDGSRLAFLGGPFSWDLFEVETPGGRVRSISTGGGVSSDPSWAPGGVRYAFATNRSGRYTVEEVAVGDGRESFSRTLTEHTSSIDGLRWSPDGTRLLFRRYHGFDPQLLILNAASGRVVPLDEEARASSHGVWSPDGEWIAYARLGDGGVQLVKVRPGSRTPPAILKQWSVEDPPESARAPVDWSRSGEWILTGGLQSGLHLIAADGSAERQLSSRSAAMAFQTPPEGFSRDGAHVLRLLRNESGDGAEWHLVEVDIASGHERVLADVDLPPTVTAVRGFGLHPDGTRFLITAMNPHYDIWMLEGFDATR